MFKIAFYNIKRNVLTASLILQYNFTLPDTWLTFIITSNPLHSLEGSSVPTPNQVREYSNLNNKHTEIHDYWMSQTRTGYTPI